MVYMGDAYALLLCNVQWQIIEWEKPPLWVHGCVNFEKNVKRPRSHTLEERIPYVKVFKQGTLVNHRDFTYKL